ncbi:type III secretion system gatekeeper subunit SctW [Erwinia tracheiphila]|uniref:Invasion protein n=1 Tax=Erwinia tracheiphila TaxID=65700 RepID=A0A0M2KCR0_9GAMM|nr:type III secretion system gatekeeper subunit SctW [Erwinia tracheiphila]AXF77644.1 YopN family type III secretion system gatekeeper subunit [Erwinia tracheiphila]EOS94421.1 type III secretion system protein [Erwinia tracheiphila PSU-1]KKF36734.1 invasion protein [Erwinia tracheiphila]UIA83669.1 type III secretion system gatekeeper subunit SctW [Erwinia tracheiphila]UIA88069.1 type III secretion system gatekeeper subunit SctW [Erwinia tracheiphila]
MSIRIPGSVDIKNIDDRSAANTAKNNKVVAENTVYEPVVDLQSELFNASEELSGMLSMFGRFNRTNRKNISEENDYYSSILEDHAEEKLDTLIKQVPRLQTQNNILNFARGLFPDDSDLMMALRQLLLSRWVSELAKKKIKEAIKDLEKFGEQQKMRSGINVASLAKRFSTQGDTRPLTAKDLRNSYLRFLGLNIPAGFIYQDWIDEFGFENRKRLLVFTLSALIADMKANEPGIHFAEFGPLNAKLSDARVLHTLDLLLNDNFRALTFYDQLKNENQPISEDDVVGLYMKGIVNCTGFKPQLKKFNDQFMSSLFIKQRAEVIQSLHKIYKMTPAFIFPQEIFKDEILNMILLLSDDIYKREKKTGIWSEYYK